VLIAIAIPAGLLIGLSLGALGGGGSILTVPALVYLLRMHPHAATTGSLLIVGITALAGMAAHWRAGRVRIAQGVTFGVLGVAGSYAGSRLSASIRPSLLLSLFAGLMLAAAVAMLRRGRSAAGAATAAADGSPAPAPSLTPAPSLMQAPPAAGVPSGFQAADAGLPMTPGGPLTAGPLTASGPAVALAATPAPALPVPSLPVPATPEARPGAPAPGRALKIVAAATVVGLLTGFFGVGGGFVIVPALVLALGFEMPIAVGTSLLVIAVNSVAALGTRLSGGIHLDWPLLGVFTVAALAGALAGNRLASRVSASRLTGAFTVLLVAVAAYTLARSLPGLL
jgi:uncharacterized membrane protein YfcA